MPRKKMRHITCQPVTCCDQVDLIFVLPDTCAEMSPASQPQPAYMLQGKSKTLHCKPTVPVKPTKPDTKFRWRGQSLPSSHCTESYRRAFMDVQNLPSDSGVQPPNHIITKKQESSTCVGAAVEWSQSKKEGIVVDQYCSRDPLYKVTAENIEPNLSRDLIVGDNQTKQNAVVIAENSQSNQHPMPVLELSSSHGDGDEKDIETSEVTAISPPANTALLSHKTPCDGEKQHNLEQNEELQKVHSSVDYRAINEKSDVPFTLEEDDHAWYKALVALELQSKESTSDALKKIDVDRKDKKPEQYGSVLKVAPAFFFRKGDNADYKETSESRRIDRTDRRVKYLLWKESSIKTREKIYNLNAQKPWKPTA